MTDEILGRGDRTKTKEEFGDMSSVKCFRRRFETKTEEKEVKKILWFKRKKLDENNKEL